MSIVKGRQMAQILHRVLSFSYNHYMSAKLTVTNALLRGSEAGRGEPDDFIRHRTQLLLHKEGEMSVKTSKGKRL